MSQSFVWRRWPRIFICGIAILAIAIAGYVGSRRWLLERRVRLAEADVLRAIAEVDAAFPDGWQLADLERRRVRLADKDNGAFVVLSAAERLPHLEMGLWIDPSKTPPNQRLSPDDVETMKETQKVHEALLDTALAIENFQTGRYPLPPLDPDQLFLANPHPPKVATVIQALEWNAWIEAEVGDPVKAWRSALAMLPAARTIGDDPLLSAQAVRLSPRGDLAKALQRILGMGVVPTAELRRARRLIREEQSTNTLVYGVRGELAVQHDFYRRLADGNVVKFEESFAVVDPLTRRAMIAESHAFALRTLVAAIDRLAMPEDECDRCLTMWNYKIIQLKIDGTIPLPAGVLTPAIQRIQQKATNGNDLLDCAGVALAAEEFRIDKGRWPKDAEELLAAKFIDRIPIDRETGKPLQLRIAPDGFSVYSVGRERRYKGDNWDHLLLPLDERPDLFTGILEFRLWNPESRRKPAAE